MSACTVVTKRPGFDSLAFFFLASIQFLGCTPDAAYRSQLQASLNLDKISHLILYPDEQSLGDLCRQDGRASWARILFLWPDAMQVGIRGAPQGMPKGKPKGKRLAHISRTAAEISGYASRKPTISSPLATRLMSSGQRRSGAGWSGHVCQFRQVGCYRARRLTRRCKVPESAASIGAIRGGNRS